MAENQVPASRDRNLSKRAVRSVTHMRPVDEFTMTPAPAPATGEDGRRRATVTREARRWPPDAVSCGTADPHMVDEDGS